MEFMRKRWGWLVLQFPMRRDGKQWGEHQNCDELICLWNALGLCLFTLDRSMGRSCLVAFPMSPLTDQW